MSALAVLAAGIDFYELIMRLKKLTISGYRGFSSFVIGEKELNDLTIIAGQNGTGKSTILEIISYLLNSHDYSQLIDPDIFQGITADESLWEVRVALKPSEIDFIVLIIGEMSQYYGQRSKTIRQKIRDSLVPEGNEYCFTLRLKLVKTPDPYYRPEVEFIGSNTTNTEIPPWIVALQEKQILFCQYIKPLENLGEIVSTYFSSRYYDPELLKLNNTTLNLKNRNIRSNVNLNQYLKSLALGDVYGVFKKNNGKFTQLDSSLELINRVINPIVLKYNEKNASNGYLAIEVHNKKTRKSYPLSLASSGEKQVIGLASLILSWNQSPFKPIILMDEPDVHLHPNYVDRLGKFVSSIFGPVDKFTCIIATHSPELISETANHVYQISPDSKHLIKVDNFKERNALLGSLGKRPELSYLAPKIVFVEGSQSKKKDISDCEVYQSLIDNNQNNIIFIPMNGKSTAMVAQGFNEYFVKIIASKGKRLKIYTLVDGDNQKGKSKPYTYKTPFKHLENVFILDALALSKAVSQLLQVTFTRADAQQIIKTELTRQGKTVLKADGKRAFGEIHRQLLTRFQGSNLDRKDLQYAILNNLAITRLPKTVQKFISSIKRS